MFFSFGSRVILGRQAVEPKFFLAEKKKDKLSEVISLLNNNDEIVQDESEIRETLLQYIQENKDDPDGYYLLGSMLYSLDQYEAARDYICIALYLSNKLKIIAKLNEIETSLFLQYEHSNLSQCEAYHNISNFKYNLAPTEDALDEELSKTYQMNVAQDYRIISPLMSFIPLHEIGDYYRNSRLKYEQEYYNDSILSVTTANTLDSTLYSIEYNNKKYQCVAKKKILEHTIILEEYPYAIAPLIDHTNFTLFPTCFHCLRERVIDNRAIACPSYPYSCPLVFCSKSCALLNANIHRQECVLLNSAVFSISKETHFTPGFILLVLRVLIKSYIQVTVNSQTPDYTFFFRLHNHEENRSWIKTKIARLTESIQAVLPNELQLFLNYEDMFQLLCILHSYALPITYESPNAVFQLSSPIVSIGLALGLNISHFEHSCYPNCAYTYNSDGKLVLRALRDISLNEQLTISYLEDLYLPISKRKHTETSLKIYTCTCKLCSLDPDVLQAQRCSVCIIGLRVPIYDRSNSEKVVKTYIGWKCTKCGKLTDLESERCNMLESKMEFILRQSREELDKGNYTLAINKLNILIDNYSKVVHADHYLLYTAHIFAAGLLNKVKDVDYQKIFFYLKKAYISANIVLPEYSKEKLHISSRLATVLYVLERKNDIEKNEKFIDLKLKQEGPPFFFKIALSTVIQAKHLYGTYSHQWIASINRLRLFARTIVQHTPPLYYKPKIVNKEYLLKIISDVYQTNVNLKEATKITDCDHQTIIHYSCSKGLIKPILLLAKSHAVMKRELETLNLILGLTALGMAAFYYQKKLVSLLISDFQCDPFAENEWNVTPLIAMASRTRIYCFQKTSETRKKFEEDDNLQAEICIILLKYVEKLEFLRFNQLAKLKIPIRDEIEYVPKEYNNYPFLRYRLLYAKTHCVIGSNTACHYAAARGKTKLLIQLIRSGVSPNVRNNEEATPLHIASVAGNFETVDALLKHEANPTCSNFRGENALMMAIYNLHPKTVSILLENEKKLELINHISEDANMSILHCLVSGLLSVYKSEFGKCDKDHEDPLINTWSLKSEEPIYTITYVSIPGNQSISKDFFVNPESFLKRIKKAEKVYELIEPCLTAELLDIRLSKTGQTALELFDEKTIYFLEQYNSVWSQNESMSNISYEERFILRKEWHVTFERLNKLKETIQNIQFH